MSQIISICFLSGIKHELIERIADFERIKTPKDANVPALESLPSKLPEIQKLPIYVMKKILFDKGFCSLGIKDELALRLYLLRNGRCAIIGYHVRKSLENVISIAEKIIHQLLTAKLTSRIQRRRSFATPGQVKSRIPVPAHITNIQDLIKLLGNLKHFLKVPNINGGSEENRGSTGTIDAFFSKVDEREKYFEIGTLVKVKWSNDQLGTGWKPGWYTATVQSSDMDNDLIHIIYHSEKDIVYPMEVTPSISSGRIKLVKKN